VSAETLAANLASFRDDFVVPLICPKVEFAVRISTSSRA